MNSFTEQIKERIFFADPVDPDQYSANTYTTGALDMQKARRAVAIINTGDMATSSTLNGKWQESANGSTGWADISGGSGNSITALTQAGSDGDKIVTAEIRSDQLTAGYRYVRFSVTTAVDVIDLCVNLIGFDPSYSPANGFNNAAVDEQVVKASA